MSAHHGIVNGRRADLDWVRVGAFGLLILFHVALVYSPYDWHVQSAHRFGWMPEALLLTGPWRLTLLFLVSGAALRFMTARRTAGQVVRARLERLGPPLVMGVLLLVSIQSWIEALDNGWWSGGWLGWLGHEFGLSGLMDGVPVNHLWFVLYIGVYSLMAVVLIRREGLVPRLEARLAGWLGGWRVLALPATCLVLIRVTLFPAFGITNNLVWDPYNHLLSFGAFLFGFLLARRETVWADLERFRWLSLAVACACLPVMMIQWGHPGGNAFLGVPRHLVQGLDQWAAIAAILGFGSRHLRRADGPMLRYLTDAVFPCYLAHQTILVAAVWLIRPAALPALPEALLLIGVTFGGSLAVYEAVRRIPALRPWWGLKPVAVARAPFARRLALLRIGALAPLMPLAAVAAAVLTYPGFDHASQYLSELGGATARFPAIFNVGVFVAGLLAGLTGLGFALALNTLTRARITGALTALAFVLAGVGLAGSSLYPWPDERHMIISLGLGIQVAPLLLLWGLRERHDVPRLKLFLGAAFVAMAVLTLFTKHLIFPGLVNDANVGWWERAYAAVLIGWAGVAALALERRLRREAAALSKV